MSQSGSHTAPFTDWSSAATNLQAAIDASADGDRIWVTNGIYASGGKVIDGDLTNRVALDKAVTLQSVNGAAVTTIQGCPDSTFTNGPAAIRCVWMTNNAVLRGFTLSCGATRASLDMALGNGGGVYGTSTNALVYDCVFSRNLAANCGGGAWQVAASNCLVLGNMAGGNSATGFGAGVACCIADNCRVQGNQLTTKTNGGGGAAFSLLRNCLISGNWLTNPANSTPIPCGAGAFRSTLLSCTIVSNTTWNSYAAGGGAAYSALTNCILLFNATHYLGNSGTNYLTTTQSYCCSIPLSAGVGNTATLPGFYSDGVHQTASSPNLGGGLATALSGTDLDGQPWANPPAMGCDEWNPTPVMTGTPTVSYFGFPCSLLLSGPLVVGQAPIGYSWYKDGSLLEDSARLTGTHSTHLTVRACSGADAGTYWLLASNASGLATSSVVNIAVHFVDAASPQPAPPYSSWETAAATLQDAVDVAAPYDLVLVTNGLYNCGGRIVDGDLSNRVAVLRPMAVSSVNGAAATLIQGCTGTWTNSITATRCVWLADNATLSGFTLLNGATRLSAANALGNGGGVYGLSTNALVTDCVLSSNQAASSGGGAFQVVLSNCVLSANQALSSSYNGYGGAAASCWVYNCRLVRNQAYSGGAVSGSLVRNSLLLTNLASYCGGGAYGSTLYDCTVVSNQLNSGYSGGGAFSSQLTNCILFYNSGPSWDSSSNYDGLSSLGNCCSRPLASGSGNITNAPQFCLGDFHLQKSSPCVGTGLAEVVQGRDLDGQAWATPPSIGCDEWGTEPKIVSTNSVTASGYPLTLTLACPQVDAANPVTYYWYQNGQFIAATSSNLVLSGLGPESAGQYWAVASNADGLATGTVSTISIHCAAPNGATPVPPYTFWATAATNLQDALDAAADGDFVLATNGVYHTGGRVMSGDLTNRAALTHACTLLSMNGAEVTTIAGSTSDVFSNGPGAIRCVWMTNNAVLTGFKLQHGATRVSSDASQGSGGGVYSMATNALLTECILGTNSAAYWGGGAYGVILSNCLVISNSAGVYSVTSGGGGAANCVLYNCQLRMNQASSSQSSGGGAALSTLRNCLVQANTSAGAGGVYESLLYNCTVINNLSLANGLFVPGGILSCTATNCIVVGNANLVSNSTNYNFYGGALSYSCSLPLAAGTGNTTNVPHFLQDGWHLADDSACRSNGLAGVSQGSDLDDQPWEGTPSMGCDQWEPAPLVMAQARPEPLGFPLAVNIGGVLGAGQTPQSCAWYKDGALLNDDAHYSASGSTNLVISQFGPADAGNYWPVLSNAFGLATGKVISIVVHCADAAGASPLAPYSTWQTAATSLQDAADVAADGDFILATNGLYCTGGRAVGGVLTNRVCLLRAVTLSSINGPDATVIQGAWDPSTTNGPAAVRGVLMGSESWLHGFTIQGGATAGSSTTDSNQCGGGVYFCDIWSAQRVIASTLRSNTAASFGGGAGGVAGFLERCRILNNSAPTGGGVYECVLRNSLIQSNTASQQGGGVYSFYAWAPVNCTITRNSAPLGGGFAVDAPLHGYVTNCIIRDNYTPGHPEQASDLYLLSSYPYFYNCCLAPLSQRGLNCVTNDPLLLSDGHLAQNSPCRQAGAPVGGTLDIDGESWAATPSIGCDEIYESDLSGPLAVSLASAWPVVAERGWLTLFGQISGRASSLAWNFGDGTVATNLGCMPTHVWTNAGDYTVTLTAYNQDNPAGVSATTQVHVVGLSAPALSGSAYDGTNYSFQFNGQPGVNYCIEQSTNLTPPIVWTPLATNINGAGGLASITAAKATNAACFYRLRVQ